VQRKEIVRLVQDVWLTQIPVSLHAVRIIMRIPLIFRSLYLDNYAYSLDISIARKSEKLMSNCFTLKVVSCAEENIANSTLKRYN